MAKAWVAVRSHRYLLGAQALLIAVGVVVRWPSMSYPLTEMHAFRQTQTALMIREFMQNGMFQLSPLPLFGPPWQVPMELPLFQWLAALGGNLVGTTPQIAGRLTALAFFELSAILAAYLAYRWFSAAASIATMVLFQFLPFGIQWGNAPMIEFLAVAGVLGAVVCIEHWRSSHRWGWIAGAAVTLSVGVLVKPTTALAWLPIYAALSVDWTAQDWLRRNLRRWPTVVPLLVSGALGIAWTKYADSVKAESRFTEFLTSSNLSAWNYGTFEQRQDSHNLQIIVSYTEAIIGSLLAFAILLVVALIVWVRRDALIGLALALPVAVSVFFNLYYMHNYYQCAVYAALVMVMGAGIGGLVRLAPTLTGKTAVVAVALMALGALAWTSADGQTISQRTAAGTLSFPMADEIVKYVPEGAGVLMVGCDWDPDYFYLSGRRGLMMRNDQLGEPIPAEWLGNEISYVAICDPTLDTSHLLPADTVLQQLSGQIWQYVPQTD